MHDCTLESEINDPGTFINASSFSHGYDLISEGTFINSYDFSIHDWKDKETYKTRKFGKHVFYSFQWKSDAELEKKTLFI